jgi:hypothetical protein
MFDRQSCRNERTKKNIWSIRVNNLKIRTRQAIYDNKINEIDILLLMFEEEKKEVFLKRLQSFYLGDPLTIDPNCFAFDKLTVDKIENNLETYAIIKVKAEGCKSKWQQLVEEEDEDALQVLSLTRLPTSLYKEFLNNG